MKGRLFQITPLLLAVMMFIVWMQPETAEAVGRLPEVGGYGVILQDGAIPPCDEVLGRSFSIEDGVPGDVG